jgi:hypothetical protein
MAIKVYEVKTSKALNRFIRLPWKIYENCACWVPPLLLEQKQLFNKEKCPFLEHSQAALFIAEEDGVTLGRIAAIRNNKHLEVYKDKTGFFGFFECIDNQAVADILFREAGRWLGAQGLNRIRGPENFSQNEEVGLLVDTFDLPPVVLMTYNPPYYQRLIEVSGFKKAMDLYAYNIENVESIPRRLEKHIEKIKKRHNYTIRTMDLKNIDREVQKIQKVYNTAWSENWGAVPLTSREIEEIKNKLIQIVNPDLLFFAEQNGETVGVSITVPDINEALIRINGRLFPLGLAKLLWYKRSIKGVRVFIMGVLKEHRLKGIETSFYYETFKNGLKHGFHKGEMSWILENNYPMRNALEKIYGAKIYKTYRLYEKDIKLL